jgi:MoxR-like ATPase
MTKSTTALPECWQTVDECLAAGIDRLILFGPPGLGKTYAGLTLGDVEAGAFRLICTEDMTTAEVTGCFIPNEQGTFTWNFGSALKAWQGDGKRGGRLVVDEIDKASGDVAATLLAMLDTPESASWAHPTTGMVIRPLTGFSAVMTTNLEQMEELPTALADRFPVRVRINAPHPDALKRLSPDLHKYAIRMADAGDRRISLRAFYDFDRLRTELGDAKAASIIFRDRSGDLLDAIKVDGVSA